MSWEYIEKSFSEILEKYSINLDHTTLESIKRSIFYIKQAITKTLKNPDEDLSYIIETLTYSLTKNISEIEDIPQEAKEDLYHFLIITGIPEELLNDNKITSVKAPIVIDIQPESTLERLENIVRLFIKNILPDRKHQNNASKNQTQEINTNTLSVDTMHDINKEQKQVVRSKPKISFVERITKEREVTPSQTKNLTK